MTLFTGHLGVPDSLPQLDRVYWPGLLQDVHSYLATCSVCLAPEVAWTCRGGSPILMMLAMFAGENRDDWDDLLSAVMMAYRSSVHESTGFSPYRLMFGEECTLPMDVGLTRRDQDSPDPIKNPYALWVQDALEVAYDQVRRIILVRLCSDRSTFMLNGLSDTCLLWGIGLCVITHG